MFRRATFLVGVTGLLFGLSRISSPIWAESPSPKTNAARTEPGEKESQQSSGKAEKAPRRPALPDYFGQLGISDKQRLDLQNVQMSYEERLDRLRDELQALTKERDEKLESLLTEGQKLRLQELQALAKEKAKAKKSVQKK